MTRKLSPEVQILAGLSSTMKADYTSNDLEWADSPFAWIRTRKSRQIGAIAEKLITEWLSAHGFSVDRSPDSEADRVIESLRVEIKFSSLWDTGIYKFQQLRDQNYEFAICLGISPFNAHCWALPKSVILEQWQLGNELRSQHAGVGGKDTAWLSVRPDHIPAWLAEHGGSLREGLEQIAALTSHTLPDLPK